MIFITRLRIRILSHFLGERKFQNDAFNFIKEFALPQLHEALAIIAVQICRSRETGSMGLNAVAQVLPVDMAMLLILICV